MFRRRIAGLMVSIVVIALGIKGLLTFREIRRLQSGRAALLAMAGSGVMPALTGPELESFLADPETRGPAAWALDRLGSTSPALVRVLVEQLVTRTPDAPVRFGRVPHRVTTVPSLKRIQPPGSVLVPLLAGSATNPDRWIRSQVIEALSDVAERPGATEPSLAPILLAALGDEVPAISLRAAEALSHVQGDARRRAIAILLDQLRRSDRPRQLEAAVGLARFGPDGRAAVAILADRLDAGDTAARLKELYLIGRLGPVAIEAVPPILRAMASSGADQALHRPLNDFLRRWDDRHMGDLNDLVEQSQGLWTPLSMGAAVLARIGPEADRRAIDLLIPTLAGPDPSRMMRSLDALGALGPRASSTIPTLLGLMEPENPPAPRNDLVSYHLMRAFAEVTKAGDPRFGPAMLRMLRSSDPGRRSNAAWVLGWPGRLDPAAVPILVGMLKDDPQFGRFAAANTLGQYDGECWEAAAPALLDALADADGGVRSQVAKALARHGAGVDRAVPILVRMLRGELPDFRWQAAVILGEFGPAAVIAVPALGDSLEGADGILRGSIEDALKLIVPPGSPSGSDPAVTPPR